MNPIVISLNNIEYFNKFSCNFAKYICSSEMSVLFSFLCNFANSLSIALCIYIYIYIYVCVRVCVCVCAVGQFSLMQ